MSVPEVPRILVVRRRYLGDVVLLGALLRNLRLHWPDARLTVLVEPRFAEAIALNADANEALSLPRTIRAWPGFLRRVRPQHFTHVLDLDNIDKTALIARWSGAHVRVGLGFPRKNGHQNQAVLRSGLVCSFSKATGER